MTEKRFMLGYVCGDYGLIDNAQSKGNQWIDLHSMSENSEKNVQLCINKMNKLAEENKQLKFQLDECQNHKLYSRRELEKENEQLKKQLQSEHQMLQNAIQLERTRMGKNSLKQYKEAIQ